MIFLVRVVVLLDLPSEGGGLRSSTCRLRQKPTWSKPKVFFVTNKPMA